jgi:hypothetical protein
MTSEKATCPNQRNNIEECNCTYGGCSRKGICCECISYHRLNKELPACFFTAEDEKTYDRSMRKFINRYR